MTLKDYLKEKTGISILSTADKDGKLTPDGGIRVDTILNFSLPSDTVTHRGHPPEEICGHNKINEPADKKSLDQWPSRWFMNSVRSIVDI